MERSAGANLGPVTGRAAGNISLGPPVSLPESTAVGDFLASGVSDGRVPGGDTRAGTAAAAAAGGGGPAQKEVMLAWCEERVIVHGIRTKQRWWWWWKEEGW